MSRHWLVAGVVSKAAWLATLALDQLDSATLGGGLILALVGLLPTAYHLTDKALDRVMQLPDVFEAKGEPSP